MGRLFSVKCALRVSVINTGEIIDTHGKSLLSVMPVEAKELTDKLLLNGVISGALQCQQLSANSAGEEACKPGANRSING